MYIGVPKNIDKGDTGTVSVVVLDVKFLNGIPQTRSLSLTLNGVPVSGSPVSITLTKKKPIQAVPFKILFAKQGTAVLKATLSPADVNPANDTLTRTVTVRDRHDHNQHDAHNHNERNE